MMEVRPFETRDMDGFALHPMQARDHLGPWSPRDAARVLAAGGRAFTLRRDGRVLLVAGVAKVDESYGHAWAFMAAEAGPHMRALTRKVRGYLDSLLPGQRRIEMMVRADFAAAARWARLLGFEQEGVLRMAAADGADMVRFARVNPAWRPVWGLAA